MKSVAIFLIGFFPYALFLATVGTIIVYPAITVGIMVVVPVVTYGLAKIGIIYLLKQADHEELERIYQQLKGVQFPARVINILAGIGLALSGILMILSIPFFVVNLLARLLINEIEG